MTERLHILLLGPFVIKRDGLPVPDSAWYTRQARQLLKILLTQRHRAVPADQLMEWLWPDSPPAAAAITLRTTASALRHVLEPERSPRSPSRYVVTKAPGYAFEIDEAVFVDVVAFDELIDKAASAPDPASQRNALEAAVQLYRGDYLADDPYAEWAQVERERLAERYLRALADLAELHATSGEYEQACSYCRRILAHDPCRELAYRALMLYQSRAGDIAGALRSYERCRRNLADELGVAPSEQTQAIYRDLLRGEIRSDPEEITAARRWTLADHTTLPPFSAPFADIFVGREVEATFLRQCLDRALAGEGATIAIEGETGVGKTRLAFDVLERGLEERALVLSGRCIAVGERLPYAPLAEGLGRLVRSLPLEMLRRLPQAELGQVAKIIPGLRDMLPALTPPLSTTPAEDQQRLADGIVRVLVALAGQQRGLLLFLDDVQWVDDATLTLIAQLAPQVNRTPLLLLLAYSVEEIGEHAELLGLLRLLSRHRFLQRLTLARLSPLDVGAFVELLVGDHDTRLEALAEYLYRLSEGNALFLVETVRAILDRQGLADPGSLLSAATAGELPRQIRDVILARLARLPEEARAVLDLAAIVGRAFSLDLLEIASINDPLSGLEVLLRRRFLHEERGSCIDFSHQLVRQVVLDDLSALARRRLHRRVANALVSLAPGGGASAAEIAFHYKQAGEASSRELLRYAVRAGDEALQAFGFRQAVAHYDDALAAGQCLRLDAESRALVERAYYGRGNAFEAIGDRQNLVSTYHCMRAWAKDRDDQALQLEASRRLVSALAVFGYLEESSNLSTDLVAQLPPDAPPAVIDLLRRVSLLLRPAEQAAPEGRLPRFYEPPEVRGAPWDDLVSVLGPQQAVQPLYHYGWTLLTQGQLAEADACFRRTIDLAADCRQIAAQLTSYQLLAHKSELQGDWARMREWLERALTLSAQLPETGWPIIWTRLFLGFLQLRVGWLERAGDCFQAIYEELAASGEFPSHRLTTQVGLGWLALRRHDSAKAHDYFARALSEPAHLFAPIYVWACLGQARAASLLGHEYGARQMVSTALALSSERSMPREYVAAALATAHFAIADGAPLEAEQLLEAAIGLAERTGLRPALLDAKLAHHLLSSEENSSDMLATLRAQVAEQRAALAAAIPQLEEQSALLTH